jgi:hypothetical protein
METLCTLVVALRSTGGQHAVQGWVHAYRLNVEQANRARHKCRQGHKKGTPSAESLFLAGWVLVFTPLAPVVLSPQTIMALYRGRWQVEIAIHDSNAFDGLGQDQCRKRQRILGANTFRLVMAAARTLWFIAQVDRGTEVPLCRYRPWYRQKVAPSQLDVAEACREALYEAGIFPIPRFIPALAENQEELDTVLPLAA